MSEPDGGHEPALGQDARRDVASTLLIEFITPPGREPRSWEHQKVDDAAGEVLVALAPHVAALLVQAAAQRLTNADLTRALITKHGVDRYPTPELNALKLFEEAGEMIRHLLRGEPAGDELADMAICLYALADKLGLNLDAEIRTKVNGDIRSFS